MSQWDLVFNIWWHYVIGLASAFSCRDDAGFSVQLPNPIMLSDADDDDDDSSGSLSDGDKGSWMHAAWQADVPWCTGYNTCLGYWWWAAASGQVAKTSPTAVLILPPGDIDHWNTWDWWSTISHQMWSDRSNRSGGADHVYWPTTGLLAAQGSALVLWNVSPLGVSTVQSTLDCHRVSTVMD